MSARPIIGIPADRRMIGPHPFHMVGEKYADAITRAAGGLPLLIPVLPDRLAEVDLLDSLDGLLFPGSPSNVEPHHYDEGPSRSGTLHDPERDATTLPLVRAALAMQVQLQQVHTAAHAARRTLRSSLQSARGLCSRGDEGHTHRLRFTLSTPAVES